MRVNIAMYSQSLFRVCMCADIHAYCSDLSESRILLYADNKQRYPPRLPPSLPPL